MLHLALKHFLQFCHLSKYLCRAVSTPRCLLVKRNGETFKADQAAQITQTHLLISREKFDPRAEGGLEGSETSPSVDPGLSSSNQIAVTILLSSLRRRIANERDSAMLQKLKRVLPGAEESPKPLFKRAPLLKTTVLNLSPCCKASWVKDCY